MEDTALTRAPDPLRLLRVASGDAPIEGGRSTLVGPQVDGDDVFCVPSEEAACAFLRTTEVDAVILEELESSAETCRMIRSLREVREDLPIVIVENTSIEHSGAEWTAANRIASLPRSEYDPRGVQSLVRAMLSRDHRPSWIDNERIRLEYEASHDPLTGLNNRRGLEKALSAVRSSVGGEGPCSVAIIDCDDFKSINSRFGHATGDLALTRIASLLSLLARGSDLVARVGGDEFLLLLPSVRLTEAHNVGERIRRAIEQ